MFDYADTVEGHKVTNTGHNYTSGLWRFEHTKLDADGDWVPVAVEYLELGPSSASTWEEYRERFVLAFPNAYGYEFHKCDFPEIPDEESNCWHVLKDGQDIGEEDQGFESKSDARDFLRSHLRELEG